MKKLLLYLPAIICSVLIPMLSLMSIRECPYAAKLHFDGMDKVIHLLMYAALTSLWIHPIPAAKRSRPFIMAGVALAAGLYGALMEICQFLLKTNRTMDPFDALANLVGALIAAAGFYFHSKSNAKKPQQN